MKKYVELVLLICVMCLTITACTGIEGESLTDVRGEGIAAITGDGLRDHTKVSSVGDNTSTAGILDGTFYAEDGSSSITFSGNSIVIDAADIMGALGGDITYVLSGNTLVMTVKVSIMGATYEETSSVSFMWDGSSAFYLDGVRFIR